MRAIEFITENKKPSLADAVEDFMPLAIEFLKLPSLPEIKFSKDVKSKHDQPTFGCYHHSDEYKAIELDIEERNPNDIIRTLAHELVHYKKTQKVDWAKTVGKLEVLQKMKLTRKLEK